jgi:hypothetical protein
MGATMTNPKKAIIVGNCQAEFVARGLGHDSLNGRLDVKYHYVHLEDALQEQAQRDLEKADLLLFQEVSDWEKYPLRQHIPSSIETIGFPCLWFASLWPFDGGSGQTDRLAEAVKENETFTHFDGLLGRLREKFPDKESRFAAYAALDFPGIINFHRLHNYEARRLANMDKKFNCAIGQFIVDEFRGQHLFHAPNRPNSVLYARLIQYILDRLSIPATFQRDARMDEANPIQVPVHPKVAQALEVVWVDTQTRYTFRDQSLTWEEYVRKYIDHYG